MLMHDDRLGRKARDLIDEKKLPFKGLLNDALKIVRPQTPFLADMSYAGNKT